MQCWCMPHQELVARLTGAAYTSKPDVKSGSTIDVLPSAVKATVIDEYVIHAILVLMEVGDLILNPTNGI